MISRSIGLVLAIVFVVGAGCSKKFIDAEQCVLVDLKQDDAQKLAPFLDAFAQANGMVSDKSAPFAYMYALSRDYQKVALVSYTFGDDEHGAELALFRFHLERGADVAVAFARLVEREIKPRFGVRQCADEPNFAPMTVSP